MRHKDNASIRRDPERFFEHGDYEVWALGWAAFKAVDIDRESVNQSHISRDRVVGGTSLLSKRLEMGQAIVRFEGRYRDGNLHECSLAKGDDGDGGGVFEGAGIDERYHSEISSELRTLINCGEDKEVEQMAADYIVDHTAGVVDFFPENHSADDYPGIEFVLCDTAFNRGMKGAAGRAKTQPPWESRKQKRIALKGRPSARRYCQR